MSGKEKRQKRKRDDFAGGYTHFGQQPSVPIAPIEAVWKRVDELVPEEQTAQKPAEPDVKKDESEEVKSSKRLKRIFRALDVLAVIAWVSVIVKVYIADVDRLLFSWVAPQATWLLDLRVFAVLGLASLVLILFKRWKIGVGLAYVSFFPLIVALWKIPKFFIECGNPVLAVGALGVVTSLAARAKVWVLALTIASFSALMILLSHDPILIGIGVSAMLITLGWWFGITAIDLFRSPTIIRAHEIVIDAVLGWPIIDRIMAPKRPDRLTLKNWKKEDATAFRDAAGWAILAYHVMYFWAYLIDQFRKGPAVVVLNAFVLIGLGAQVILAFAFATYGLYVIDPSQFAFASPPDALTFLYYSASGLNEIEALKPVGMWAMGMKLLDAGIFIAGAGTIIVSSGIAFRSVKADAIAVTAIQRLKAKADEIEALASAEYEMTLEQLKQHLIDASWGMLGIVMWLTTKTPTAWVDSINRKSE